jgi:cobalt-zinc-cadmium efflux system outer membrane protein
MHTRPDIAAARQTYDAACASLRLARLNRLPDPTLGLTFQESLRGTNPIDPTPNFNSINLSVSVPLPIFNSLRGEYQVAQNTAAQAQQTLRSTELKAEVDVRSSYARYEAALTRVDQYQNGALELASKVLEAQLLSYKAGSATLLDVLQAQKADTDVHLAAIDALTERAKAIIALEQAANFWDIEF